jgi:hypothetical protein
VRVVAVIHFGSVSNERPTLTSAADRPPKSYAVPEILNTIVLRSGRYRLVD